MTRIETKKRRNVGRQYNDDKIAALSTLGFTEDENKLINDTWKRVNAAMPRNCGALSKAQFIRIIISHAVDNPKTIWDFLPDDAPKAPEAPSCAPRAYSPVPLNQGNRHGQR